MIYGFISIWKHILNLNNFILFPYPEDNSIHWERPQKPRRPEALLYQPQAPSAEVEMTSYVLLAHLTAQGTPTPEEMTSAMRIVNWITKQQNSYGGFSSTQVCGFHQSPSLRVRVCQESQNKRLMNSNKGKEKTEESRKDHLAVF